MRKLRRLGVAGGAALLSAALIVPSGGALAADPEMVTDQYGGAASGSVVQLDLLGRKASFGHAEVRSTLDSITKQLDAEAKGIATLLVPASTSIARFNDPAARGGEACALPQVQNLLGLLDGQGIELPVLSGVSLGSLLPKLELNVGCATANVAGNHEAFMAESVGGILQIRVALPELLSDLLGTARQSVNSVAGAGTDDVPAVGDLLNNVGGLEGVTGIVNGALGGILGGTPVAGAADNLTSVLDLEALAPVLNPTQTVDNFLAGLEQGDLLRINLGVSTARNAGDLQSYLSQAVSEGGSVELLPNFGGLDKPLLKITVAKSSAKVAIDRAAATPEGVAENTLVRIESALLPDLGLSSLPIVGGLLSSTGLPVADSVVPVINGLLGGVPVVDNLLGFDASVQGLGLSSGPGYIELSPGMSVRILCDGLVAPLCTEIAVGAVKAPEIMPDGRMRVESSVATIHLLKGLDSLSQLPVVGPVLDGLGLGTILGNSLLGNVLAPVTGTLGLDLGEPSDVPGIRISLAHAMAEAGGTKVMGAVQEQARELAPVAAPIDMPALPRTGGLPAVALIPFLLGASAGLRALVRRRQDI